jgi:hypothetical protein
LAGASWVCLLPPAKTAAAAKKAMHANNKRLFMMNLLSVVL